MKKANVALVVSGVFLISLMQGFGQTNIQIISVIPTIEQAMRLTWTSASNHTYEIDEADALGTNAGGGTTWNTLYSEYPSQGTNTFWLDTGNYVTTPLIVHPKYSPMRFYRIVDSGLDTTSDEPTVSIVTPTNGFIASGNLTITVTASTDQATLSTKLYVDGQEMPRTLDGSNYVINTCEWPNGTHTLFATATCDSVLGGMTSAPLARGHAVSAFVPVLFNNLVTMISFSQVFFNPAAGQTQMVTAVFPLNVNWTLRIVDISSNVVQTATGTGGSMQYGWNGTGSNGAALAPGNYYYLVTAQTNGLALPSLSGGTNGGGGSPPGPDFALPGGSGGLSSAFATMEVPLPPLPPGLPGPRDEDGNEITNVLVRRMPARRLAAGGFSPDFSPNGVGASNYVSPLVNPQTSPPAPTRPPPPPVVGILGTCGIAYDSYSGSANGTNGYLLGIPLNSYPLAPIQLEGTPGSTVTCPPLPGYKTEAEGFIATMNSRAWTNVLALADDQLRIGQLKGGGTVFNSVSLGVLMLHGAYGDDADYTAGANGCKQMYFPITAGTSVQWLRMSDMNFGGAGSNGLKWMAIYACNSLYHVNWQDMQSHSVQPYNSNLHLLLGADTLFPTSSSYYLLGNWADKMFGLPAPNPVPPLTIQAAWYASAREVFRRPGAGIAPGSVLYLASAGDAACENDTLQTNSSPTGMPFYDSTQVYP